MFFRLLFFVCSLFFAAPSFAKVPSELPKGWTHDTTFSEAGIEVLAKDDETLFFVAGPTQKPFNGDLASWLGNLARGAMKNATIIEATPSASKTSGFAFHKLVVEKTKQTPNNHILFLAKRFDPSKPIQVFRLESSEPLTKDDVSLAFVFALTIDVPLINDATIARVLERIQKEQSEAKRKEEEKKAAEAIEAAKPKPDLRRTKPGEGIPSEDLLGVAYDQGKLDYDVMSGIFKEVGVASWLLLKDGTAYYNPSIAPADFDVEKSREIEPGRWYDLKSRQSIKSLYRYDPLPKGTRVEISVKRPRVSGWRGVVTSSTQYLNLYDDGRFDISSFSLTSSDLTSDGSNTATISKSESKDGSSSSVSAQTSTGSGTVSWQKKKGINPSNMGEYFIEGLTIEFRFDDGAVVRNIFAMREEDKVFLDGTTYWE